MILAGYLRQMQFHMLTERRKINGDSADAGASGASGSGFGCSSPGSVVGLSGVPPPPSSSGASSNFKRLKTISFVSESMPATYRASPSTAPLASDTFDADRRVGTASHVPAFGSYTNVSLPWLPASTAPDKMMRS